MCEMTWDHPELGKLFASIPIDVVISTVFPRRRGKAERSRPQLPHLAGKRGRGPI